MQIRRNSILVMSAPALGALLFGALMLSSIVPNTTDKFTERMNPTGYVIVSVVRDGNEIYHYEDHNEITETGVDFIVDQISDTPSATASAQWIALSSDATAVDDDDSSLTGEIAAGGLARDQGTFGGYTAASADNDDNYTITRTFTASASHTGVQKAGLFTANSGGTMMATNTFSSVNLANGDQLTITWTIDLGLTNLD